MATTSSAKQAHRSICTDQENAQNVFLKPGKWSAHNLLGLHPVSSDLAQKIDDPACLHKDRVQIFVQNLNVANIYFTNKLSQTRLNAASQLPLGVFRCPKNHLKIQIFHHIETLNIANN